MKKLFLLTLFLSVTLNISHTMNNAAAAPEYEYAASDLEIISHLKNNNDWPEYKKSIIIMIEKDPHNVNISGNFADYPTIITPLFRSILHRDKKFIIDLLKHNADPDISNYMGETALHLNTRCLNLAIQSRYNCHTTQLNYYKSLLKLLILNGADPDFAYNNKLSPRQKACPEALLLIEQAELEKRIKTQFAHAFIASKITGNPTKLVIDYLNQKIPIISE